MATKSTRKKTSKKTKSQPKLHEVFEGRRKYPRIKIESPASIKVSKESIVEAIVHDVSIDGLQIRCDRETASIIHPSGKFIRSGKRPKVEVTFFLHVDGEEEVIIAACVVYYLAVIPETNEIAFGLFFNKIISNKLKVIERFIMDYLVPVEEKVRTFLDKPRSQKEISDHMKMPVTDVHEVLDRLKIKGDVISIEDQSDTRHLKLSSALVSIFTRLEKLEQHLGKQETKPGTNNKN